MDTGWLWGTACRSSCRAPARPPARRRPETLTLKWRPKGAKDAMRCSASIALPLPPGALAAVGGPTAAQVRHL
jgi:hypothetical protein